jgi:REP element-mobilizing transposase RayT
VVRPLRIEFCGALYHITARGDRGEAIYEDDDDREMFLGTLANVIAQHNWRCHAYCLMTNHYHLIIETPDANLSKGMRHLNGVFSQASNRRHRRVGHVFQGRFVSIIVDKDSYLLELTRYVVLNPVRARIVDDPGDWQWSSYAAMVGPVRAPDWLLTDVLLTHFGTRRGEARERYRQFVAAGQGGESIWKHLRQQIYLGDDNFVQRTQEKIDTVGDELCIPRIQRRAPVRSLDEIFRVSNSRGEAIAAAYSSGAYSYRQIAQHLGLHASTVRRIARRQMLTWTT